MTINVLFVCLGNICRSPTAHGLFRHKVAQAGLQDDIVTDSAGTGDWHLDYPPDERAQQTALARGYDISDLRSRLVTADDFSHFHYILGMDKQNILNMTSLKPDNYSGAFGLFLDVAHGDGSGREVDDPYYGGQKHFEEAIHLIEDAAEALLQRIRNEHSL